MSLSAVSGQRQHFFPHIQVLPPWLTTVLLAALLILLSTKLIHRGVLTYQSETKALRAAADDADQSAALEAPLLGAGASRAQLLRQNALGSRCTSGRGVCKANLNIA